MYATSVLQGSRILSLALNLPGPATLQRCRQLGAICTKIEPPAGDPMAAYSSAAYQALHQGVRVMNADLKSAEGRHALEQELVLTDVLITSFRPSALARLGLDWESLHARFPRLCVVRILGSTEGDAAELPGHDLTYQAEAGLLAHDRSLPTSLFADMGGALLGSEAVLATLLERRRTELGALQDVGLAQAAHWLAQPLHWGLTTPEGDVGGAHAGYRLYPCADGQVAVAALEPHFARRLCAAAGLDSDGSPAALRAPATHAAIARFLASQSRAQLAALATMQDLPLHPLG